MAKKISTQERANLLKESETKTHLETRHLGNNSINAKAVQNKLVDQVAVSMARWSNLRSGRRWSDRARRTNISVLVRHWLTALDRIQADVY